MELYSKEFKEKIERYKNKYGKICIQICSKDRATEVCLLLESLRNQTYNHFDIYILDSGSQVPLDKFYFFNYIVNHLKLAGHNVKLFRDNIATGVSMSRQTLVDEAMKAGNTYSIYARIDDDSICDKRFLEKSLDGIDAGFDLCGAVVPMYANPDIRIRETKFVEPIINESRLNNKGELICNFDDAGTLFTEEKIIPTMHFRSTCIYKKELHNKGINYKTRLSRNGFREENLFSYAAIIAGFKLCIHTGCINYHLATPSGGERDTMNLVTHNQQIFDDTVKRMYNDHGNFLKKYLDKLGIKEKEYNKEELNKSTNLITR